MRDHVGDGSRLGAATSHYVDEGRELRGTAGALRLAADQGVLEERFLVLYGDSWLQVDPADGATRPPSESGLPALMTVYENDGRFDASNVEYADGRVVRYEKGLDPIPPSMRWIDYGLSVLTRDLIAERVPADTVADLAPLLHRPGRRGRAGRAPGARPVLRDRLARTGWPR